MKSKDAITITTIFEGSALNRDEKIGNNVLTIKKIYKGKEAYSFIGRPAMRHYLFKTLNRIMGWKETSVTQSNNVVQFDLTREDIISSEELRHFGFFYSIKGKGSITRESVIGITKAVSLFKWNGDVSFYTNHDLVKRGLSEGYNVYPNPYIKEEHLSYYKVSFAIDKKYLGIDNWILGEAPTYKKSGKKLYIRLTDNTNKIVENVEEVVPNKEYRVLSSDGEKVLGSIFVNNLDDKKVRLTFEVSEESVKKGIRDIVTAITSGLIARTSGELNTIIPLFVIASPVKAGMPVFHPALRLVPVGDGTYKVKGITDALRNAYLEYSKDRKSMLLIESEFIKADLPEDLRNLFTSNVEEFLDYCLE